MHVLSQNPDPELTTLDTISRLLTEAESLTDLTSVRDKAEFVRKCLKSARASLEAQNKAAELKLRAERQAGDALSKLNLRGGNRRSNDHDDRLTLSDLGISQNESTRWQRESRVPEAEFEAFLQNMRNTHREITSASLLKLAPSRRKQKSKKRSPAHDSPAGIKPGTYALPVQLSVEGCERLEELSAHFQLLVKLIDPLWQRDLAKHAPTAVESRAARRYLRQSAGLIAEVIQEIRQAAAADCRLIGLPSGPLPGRKNSKK